MLDGSKIKTLELINFRNHNKLSLNLNGNSYIIHGSNGSGKTNILESISLLTPGKGFKNAPLEHIIQHNTTCSYVIATIMNPILGKSKLETQIFLDTDNTYKKQIKLDDKPIKSTSSVDSYLNCIWLTPQMDNFFIQENSHKRKFIDRLIYLTNSEHLSLLSKHEKLVKERNKLLQKHQHNITKHINLWLNQIEIELSQTAVIIVINRQNFCIELNKILKNHELYPATINMSGEIEEMLSIHKYSLPVENILKEKYTNTRTQVYKTEPSDNIYKPKLSYTNIGAHKSKLKMYSINHNHYAENCSTGEQKMLLISLITSVIELLINKYNKNTPCLLLDEIGVHLDDNNLYYSIQRFLKLGSQMFITTTNHNKYYSYKQNFELLNL